MKSFITIFCIVLIRFSLSSQIPPAVINTAGLQLSNGIHQFDFSVGETVINTIASTNNICSQGYLQPILNIATNSEAKTPNNSFKIYPNPVTQYLYLESKNTNYWITLTDATGKIILNKLPNTNKIDFSLLSQGIYILTINSTLEKNSQVYRISKI